MLGQLAPLLGNATAAESSGGVSWQYLLVGSFAAIGAAMVFGTLAAMLKFWRTGRFPGDDEDATPREITRGVVVGLSLRILIGATVAIWGAVSLAGAGIL